MKSGTKQKQPSAHPSRPRNNQTTQQPGENDVSPQARPPQTSTRLRAHKQNHSEPETHCEVRKPHTPVPPWTGT
ncbi:hypothetical protein Taro_001663 [Colocasia esculenta]|uniref:Uncharacterized protein n=1 Tax=Colocasia esculenta TaxID=4460 RepID=A0A843TGP9_COLES|nr:hypothetical protein [Colocasia esculenta]